MDQDVQNLSGMRAPGATALYYGFYVGHAGHQTVGVCLHVRAHAHCLPLTAPPSARAAARPLPRTPLLVLMAVARSVGVALCAGRSALQKGAVSGPTGASKTVQARASEFLEHHASPMPLSQERHHKHTIHHKSHLRGAGRGAVRLLGAGDTVPESAPFAQPRPPKLVLVHGLIRHHSTKQLPPAARSTRQVS